MADDLLEDLKNLEIAENSSTFTEEEISAMIATKKCLLAEPHNVPVNKISNRELVLAVMASKLQPEQAAEKYQKWLKGLLVFGLDSFDDVWKDISKDGQSGDWTTLERLMKSAYMTCGPDIAGRSVLWIIARGGIPAEDEVTAIRASIIYTTAVHADLHSLRSGITFIMDTSLDDQQDKIGNKSKMQKFWQSIPLRPQKIMIMGAGYIKRFLINAAIKLASLVSKEKILKRIRFVELDDVKRLIPETSLPVYVGGLFGRDAREDQLMVWVKHRLANFPAIPIDRLD